VDHVNQSTDVSIIICTKDRPDALARALASIRHSGDLGRSSEIVVVEEADTPRDIMGVRYVHLPREGRGFGHARNVGVREAHGNLLLFTDDDCEAEQGWAEALRQPFLADPHIVGVAGAVLVKDCGLMGYAENILGFPGGGLRYLHDAKGQVVPTRYLSTCNCAYRRKTVLEAGGFLEDARLGGEDFLLAERVTALGSCVYTPMAVVYHGPRGKLGAIFRWFVRRGQSETGLFKATMDRGQFAWYLIRSSWALRILGLLFVLVHWPGLIGFVPAGALVYYVALLWRFRFARLYPSHRAAWWLVPFVKLTMDVGTEVGRWKGLTSRWRLWPDP
jgi:GT2 family glycosyltransferase